MKVNIITQSTFPDGHAATSRIKCYAKALNSRGHDVHVIAPSNVTRLDGRFWCLTGDAEGINFTIVTNRNKSRAKIANYFWAFIEPTIICLRALTTMRRHDVHLLYINTALTRFLLTFFLRYIGRRKVAIELNEYPYSTDGSRLTRLPFVSSLLRHFTCKMIFPLSHGFLTISQPLNDLAQKTAPKAKRLTIPILYDPKLTVAQKPDFSATQLYIIHAGALSERKDGILELFEAFGRAHLHLREKYNLLLKLKLTSDACLPSTRQAIRGICRKYAIDDHVESIGFCDDAILTHHLSGAVALPIVKPINLQNHFNFPTKLASYLASSRPVIAGANEQELCKYLVHERNALVFQPHDVEGIAEGIVRCVLSPELANRIGASGAETAMAHFGYANHADSLSRFFKTL